MRTKKEDFKKFKKYFRKWQKYFSLLNWEVRFTHEGNARDEGLASTTIYLENYMVVVNLCEEMSELDYKIKSMEDLAFHEVGELLLGRLRDLAGTRHSVNPVDITEADHEIIRILENTVYKDLKNKISKIEV